MNSPRDALLKFLSDLGDFDHQTLVDYGIPSFLLSLLTKDAVIKDDLFSSKLLKNVFYAASKNSHVRSEAEDALQILSKIVDESKCDEAIIYSAKALGELFKDKQASIGMTSMISLTKKLACCSNSGECKASILFALANASLLSEANKIFISSKITTIDDVAAVLSPDTVPSCCSMIANSSYRCSTAAYNFLQSEFVPVLVSNGKHIIDNTFDENEENTLVLERMLEMLANLSNSPQNQSLVESIEDVIPFVRKVLLVADGSSVVTKAARACASICYFTNSARRSFGLDCSESLTDIILRRGLYNETNEDEAESMAAIEACKALSSLLVDDFTKAQFLTNVQDVKSLVQLFLSTESKGVLSGGAMIVSILLPLSAEEQTALLLEGRQSLIANENGEAVLQRCANECYYDDIEIQPQWLTNAVALVQMKSTTVAASEVLCKVRLQERERTLEDFFSITDLFETFS